MVRTIDHNKIGKFKTLGIPLKMVGTPSSIRYAPPLLGQHTEEVLKEYLDLNATAVEELRHKKVIT